MQVSLHDLWTTGHEIAWVREKSTSAWIWETAWELLGRSAPRGGRGREEARPWEAVVVKRTNAKKSATSRIPASSS